MTGTEEKGFAGFCKVEEVVRKAHGVVTEGSISWLVRRHQNELVESGQFIPGKGRRPNLYGPDFDKVAIKLIQREATEAKVGSALTKAVRS